MPQKNLKTRAKKNTTNCCAFHQDYYRFGRRNWTRTNDPHHVKVVL